nr:hypothetical protein [uncultured Gellertiella sp.]
MTRLSGLLPEGDDGLWLPLELKGEEPPSFGSMAGLLERMRDELDQQFRNFADIRDEAMRRQQQAQQLALPEAEAKLARADLKSAVEALSVIVRTLEKVDQLQRQLVADQAALDAAPQTLEAHEALFGRLEAMIEARVAERLALKAGARPQAEPDPPPAPGLHPAGGGGLADGEPV